MDPLVHRALGNICNHASVTVTNGYAADVIVARIHQAHDFTGATLYPGQSATFHMLYNRLIADTSNLANPPARRRGVPIRPDAPITLRVQLGTKLNEQPFTANLALESHACPSNVRCTVGHRPFDMRDVWIVRPAQPGQTVCFHVKFSDPNATPEPPPSAASSPSATTTTTTASGTAEASSGSTPSAAAAVSSPSSAPSSLSSINATIAALLNRMMVEEPEELSRLLVGTEFELLDSRGLNYGYITEPGGRWFKVVDARDVTTLGKRFRFAPVGNPDDAVRARARLGPTGSLVRGADAVNPESRTWFQLEYLDERLGGVPTWQHVYVGAQPISPWWHDFVLTGVQPPIADVPWLRAELGLSFMARTNWLLQQRAVSTNAGTNWTVYVNRDPAGLPLSPEVPAVGVGSAQMQLRYVPPALMARIARTPLFRMLCCMGQLPRASPFSCFPYNAQSRNCDLFMRCGWCDTAAPGVSDAVCTRKERTEAVKDLDFATRTTTTRDSPADTNAVGAQVGNECGCFPTTQAERDAFAAQKADLQADEEQRNAVGGDANAFVLRAARCTRPECRPGLSYLDATQRTARCPNVCAQIANAVAAGTFAVANFTPEQLARCGFVRGPPPPVQPPPPVAPPPLPLPLLPGVTNPGSVPQDSAASDTDAERRNGLRRNQQLGIALIVVGFVLVLACALVLGLVRGGLSRGSVIALGVFVAVGVVLLLIGFLICFEVWNALPEDTETELT